MPQPSISVIVATQNRPADFKRCLDSFYTELPANGNVIVVDGSKDNRTKQLIDGLPNVVYVFSAAGLTAARNAGIRASDKDVIAFLDDDAVADHGWVDALLQGYDDPNIASVVGAIRQDDLPSVPAQQPPFRSWLGPMQRIVNWQQTSPTEVLNGQGGNMSFRRSVLEDIGLFDEGIARNGSSEDMDVFIRLRRRGARVLYNPKAAVTHLPGPTADYIRSQYNRHFMFWLARNNAYTNTKHFLGQKQFFWFFIVHSCQFLRLQFIRLLRAVGNNLAVTAYHLAGKFCGFCAGVNGHWRQRRS